METAKAYYKANKMNQPKVYGTAIQSLLAGNISYYQNDAKIGSYKDTEGTYGIVYVKEGDDVNCPYCGLTTSSSTVQSGIGYDVVDIKSGVFACGSKPYMYIPNSKNNFGSKHINFAYSKTSTSGNFITMDVFTSPTTKTAYQQGSTMLKSDLDFVDIPSGHRSSIAFASGQSGSVNLHSEKGLYCYDIKLQNGNYDASSAWYFNQETIDVSGKGHSSTEGLFRNTIQLTKFDQVLFASKQISNLKVGASQSNYGSYQPWQICNVKYDKYRNSSYYSKYNCGMTFMYCGYGSSSGHQVYVM